MALDGIFLSLLIEELKIAEKSHIEKIHQPSKDELVFLLRSPKFKGSLIASTKSDASRIHFTKSTPDNPLEPPNFCKLLRKYLSGAVIEEILQDGLDRAVILKISALSGLGDKISLNLVIELFTAQSNVILCDDKGKIIDALHRSDIEKSPRLIQPGATFVPKEKQNKLNPFTANRKDIIKAISESNKPLSEAFTQVLEGVSPLISRELALKAEKTSIEASLGALKKENFVPFVLIDEKTKELKDFSFLPITQYDGIYKGEKRESYCSLLDEFYTKKEDAARLKSKAQDIIKLLNNLKGRIQRKTAYRLSDLEKCKDRETLRIYGELIKANLYAIEKGSSFAIVQNYYDENLGEIKIPLNPTLSPSGNAAKYFKDYKKTYVAEQTLTKLIEEDKEELIYIDSVLDNISRVSSVLEIEEIKEELAASGYMRRNSKQKPKPYKATPKKFVSPSGFEIYVGRNNRENDFLTLKFADKTDIWLHTKNIPGSHTVIITKGREVDKESLVFAASLAAANSKSAQSDNVPVDYTLIKNVKKPSGAKAGMVIYTNNKTLYVTPLKETL